MSEPPTTPTHREFDSPGSSRSTSARDAADRLAELIDAGQRDHLNSFFEDLPPGDTAYTVAHLDEDHQTRMWALLAEADAPLAADLLEHFDDSQAADMIEVMPADGAAAIVDEMDSDDQVDVLAEIEEPTADAILEAMDPQEAADTRQRLDYHEASAGGLMITEYLAYREDQRASDVAADLHEHGDAYDQYEVRYIYTIDEEGKLTGVVPIRRLLMGARGRSLAQLKVDDPFTAHLDTSLRDLADVFQRVDFTAMPVVDQAGMLHGVVQRGAVQEAASEEAHEALMKFGGIIRGEELRSMPLATRALHRLVFLLPIMLMMLISASIIGLFQSTVRSIPILAAFLPVVAGLSGSGGNQAVAVSMRELSLGLIMPSDVTSILMKELAVAIINALVLGLLLFGATWLWQGNLYLGLVTGGALALVLPVAKCVGGCVPVMLRAIGLDPAMAASPLVATIIDLTAFFTVLMLATLLLNQLTT